MIDPITLIAALGPLVVDAGKGLIGKYLTPDGPKPTSVAETVQLMQAETARRNALGSVEGEGATYAWVNAVKAMQRPVVVYSVLLILAVQHISTGGDTSQVDNMAAMIFSWLFGERFQLKGRVA